MSTLVILPLLVPLLAGSLLLLVGRAGERWAGTVGILAVLLQLAAALALGAATADGTVLAYLVGNWPAPFGIALVADRLAVLLLGLTGLLALAGLLADRDEPRDREFHALFQLQLFGLNGAFLTADLFNLFVFFEVLLCASYALLARGPGDQRFPVATHYVVINLLASTLFLLAAAILYGVLGTLNMADLTVRFALAPDGDLPLVRAAGLMLLTVFAVKAALLPLGLWLPATYREATVAVSILFVLMTKVGVYAMLRVSTVIFGVDGVPLGSPALEPLLLLALLSLAVAALCAIAARDLRTLVSHLVIASAATLLLTVALGGPAALGAGLFYMAHSTLGAGLLFGVAGILASQRPGSGDELVPGGPATGRASTGALYLAGAVGMAGLPPLAGFVAKARLLDAVLRELASPALVTTTVTVVLVASLLTLWALLRAGSLLFWKPAPVSGAAGAHLAGKRLSALLLLGVWLALSLAPGPLMEFASRAGAQLLDATDYLDAVLGQSPVVHHQATEYGP